MIRGREAVRDAYRDPVVADSYVEERFHQPIGALLHQRQASVLRDVLRTERPARVLELAPGPARLTIEIERSVPRGVTLLDSSAQMLGHARRRLQSAGLPAHFVQGDAFQIPFRGPFDLVYSFRLIRHFEHAERMRLYGQLRELLKPGGMLVFDAVNEAVSAPLRARAAPGEYRHYDGLFRPESLRSELTEAGFELCSLVGVQHRYGVLTRLQILVAPRSRRLAGFAMALVDRYGGGEPHEWVVTCRRA